jgi:hypothetical protein
MMYRCEAVLAGLLTVQMMRAAAWGVARKHCVGRTEKALGRVCHGVVPLISPLFFSLAKQK